MAKGANSPHPPRYWLITSPRTCSNLLVKILNLDDQGVRPSNNGGYFFLPSASKHFLVDNKPMDMWTEEDHASVNAITQQCFDRFQDHILAAEREGQVLFVKEHGLMLNSPFIESQHVHGTKELPGEPKSFAVKGVSQPSRSPLNLTFLPDEFLKTWNPTFLIRHPAMMIPSLYRTCLGNFEMNGFKRTKKEPLPTELTTKWIRTLYDFYAAHFAESSLWPIVLDADDIMTCPALVSKYAQLAGLDDTKLRFSWNTASEETMKKLSTMEARMLSSINASTKIDSSKVAGRIDIDQEAVKWKSEFGEEVAQKLERWVRDAMPDYNFLHSKRLRLE
ncbi:hypothetical protein B0T10DRAFT_490392 [Thelonectria olida]|uniref:Uncharacterized protein n=1 Tax=Thelonectria olida TaxID=1576542 RepID=A0A9P8W0X9_9HYPO|nr:hypothetical protein B0T10DRAFT_490392 [Thelonectria olida]